MWSVIQANLTRTINRKDLELVLHRGDVIGVQEMHEDAAKFMLEKVADEFGFDCWIPNENAVLWKRDRFIGIKIPFGGRHRTGLTVPLPNHFDVVRVDPRWLSVKFLYDKKAEKSLAVGSTHFTPKGFTDNPEREPIIRAQMETCSRTMTDVKRKVNATVLVGDLNANFLNDRIRRIIRRKFPKRRFDFDMRKTGTFGSVLYDYVIKTKNSDLAVIETNTLTKTDSDHDFQEVIYRWKGGAQ